jgi:hypothetical protein
MPGLRFITARDLFAAFPTARREITAKATDQESRGFVKTLAADGAWRDAVGFCAYLLPRREAVFWACLCVRALAKDSVIAGEPILRTAEAWCVEPGERARRAALEAGRSGDREWAATWAAFAAGWSGGTWRAGADGDIACAPSQTAQGVRAAVLVAMCRVRMADRASEMTRLIEEAVRLAEGHAGVTYEVFSSASPSQPRAGTGSDAHQPRTGARRS